MHTNQCHVVRKKSEFWVPTERIWYLSVNVFQSAGASESANCMRNPVAPFSTSRSPSSTCRVSVGYFCDSHISSAAEASGAMARLFLTVSWTISRVLCTDGNRLSWKQTWSGCSVPLSEILKPNSNHPCTVIWDFKAKLKPFSLELSVPESTVTKGWRMLPCGKTS